MIPYLRPALIAAAVISIGGTSWAARGWFEDSKNLAAVEAQAALAAEIRQGQASIAKQVEDRLSELKVSERIIDRGIIREIQKPIYQRVCFEPGIIRMLNAAASGMAPAESDGQVPADTPAAD